MSDQDWCSGREMSVIDCPHDSLSGAGEPWADLSTVTRWRCDQCDAIVHTGTALQDHREGRR